ncbi:MAG: hypothetical protein ACFFCT_03435 [Candidatus Odinarchaeota archaeon]
MVPIPSKTKPVELAKQDTRRIKQLMKIIDSESCLRIYSYLMLFGRTTPARLRDVTGLSKATMFRNLALLSEAEILDKEELSVSDKRYNLHYFISRNLIDVMKEFHPKRIERSVIESGNQEIRERWLMSLETLPLTLNRLITELILTVAQKSTGAETAECVVVTKIIAFRVGDIEDVSLIIRMVNDLVNTFDAQTGSKRRNWKKPLSRPATMNVSLIAFGEVIPDDSCAIIAKRIDDP